MPPSSRPGHVRSRALRRAAAEDDGVKIAAKIFHFHVAADVGVGDELDSLFLHQLDAAVDEAFFQLEIGNAVHEQPADAVGPLKDGHLCPALLSCAAAASPAGPEPTTATFLPVRFSGGWGLIHPVP
jgi:hypothetical protein